MVKAQGHAKDAVPMGQSSDDTTWTYAGTALERPRRNLALKNMSKR